LWIPDNFDPFVFLWSESATRAVVVVARSEEMRFTEMCNARSFTATRVGVVDSELGSIGDQVLQLDNVYGETLSVSISSLHAASEATLPALFG